MSQFGEATIERAARRLYELIQPDIAGNPWGRQTGNTRDFYLTEAAKILDAAIPEGWRLTPCEPDDAMEMAGRQQLDHFSAVHDDDVCEFDVLSCIRAANAAAPLPGTETPNFAKDEA